MKRVGWALVLWSVGWLAACGTSPSTPLFAPSAPTVPTPPTPPPPPPTPVNAFSASGQVVVIGTTRGISGVTLTPGWSLPPVTTDAQGNFTLSDVVNPPTNPYPVTLSAAGMVDHGVWIGWTPGQRSGVMLDMIQNAPPFSMKFYSQFVRDMYDDDPGAPFALARWTSDPNFYVRTVDQNGVPVEPEVLTRILEGITDGVPAFTAGRYHASIVTGTAAQAAQTGWINVNIMRDRHSEICGNSDVGENPETINLWEDICSCGSNKVPESVVMHEVGHAMGFWHVDDPRSLMYPYASADCRKGELSAAETFHVKIAYDRPNGNTDPDEDPSTFAEITAIHRHIVVIN